jgi:hypothetical protein
MGKTDFIHCRVDPKIKKQLKQKAISSNCKDLTEFLEKIAKEDIIFIDGNVKALLQAALCIKVASV